MCVCVCVCVCACVCAIIEQIDKVVLYRYTQAGRQTSKIDSTREATVERYARETHRVKRFTSIHRAFQIYVLCLQTQPVPSPISYYLHQNPEFIHKFETLSNHFVELVVPFFMLIPLKNRFFSSLCGFLQILFQVS